MKRLFILIACLLTVAVIVAGWWLKNDMDEYLHTPLQISQAPVRYVVKSGASFRSILKDLHARKIIATPGYLHYAARKSGRASKIKAGEYHIHDRITPEELLDLLVSGRVIQYSLTLIEGWSFIQVMETIANSDVLIHTLSDSHAQTLSSVLGLMQSSPEGLFLAETYHFPAGTTDLAFLNRAHQALMDVLDAEWENRAPELPYRGPYEALIMASIIEKETALSNERAKVAGVFIRRLNRGMKLQADSTVIYAMGDMYNGNIRKKDLSLNMPHNTYVHKGLPPTPIALVGSEAIRAAVHPESGKALYFVARGDGSHQFSETLREHNRAVVKYQLK